MTSLPLMVKLWAKSMGAGAICNLGQTVGLPSRLQAPGVLMDVLLSPRVRVLSPRDWGNLWEAYPYPVRVAVQPHAGANVLQRVVPCYQPVTYEGSASEAGLRLTFCFSSKLAT
jgi:hypothetical protein